jgi:hypothetical protein
VTPLLRVSSGTPRNLKLAALRYRSLQLGLSGEASARYADEWTVSIADVTPLAHEIHGLVRAGDLTAARRLLPEERPYPAGEELIGHLLPHDRRQE